MAHLKDLLVAGPSRFIGEVAFNDNVTFNDSVTLNETLILAKNPQDAEGTSAGYPALIIGDNGSAGAHLAIDQNEIMSKLDIDSPTTLYINNNGGDASFGGNVIPKATNTLDLGTSSVKWRTLYVGDGTGSTSSSTGNIQVNGGIGVSKNSYFGGDVTADQFHITNGSAVGHITFARGDYNYIHAKTSRGKIAFVVDGKSIGNETSEMIIQDGRIAPGTTNITNLGTSALRWKAIYGVIGNFSGNLTASGNLNINGTAAIGKDTTIGNGTVSTSTTTGALKVAGGIGVEGQLNAESIKIDNVVKFQYNKTDKCVDVIFE